MVFDILFQFKTKGGSQLKVYCSSLTKEDCRRQSGSFIACDKVSDMTLCYGFLLVVTNMLKITISLFMF